MRFGKQFSEMLPRVEYMCIARGQSDDSKREGHNSSCVQSIGAESNDEDLVAVLHPESGPGSRDSN